MPDQIDTTDDIEKAGWDRRRFLKASAGGAAIAWTAPTVLGLDARAFAAGSDPDCRKSAFFDNFDQDGIGQNFAPGYATVTSLTNFVVTGGNIDIIGSGPSGGGNDLVSGNGYYIDLDGTGNADGSVTLTSKQGYCKGEYAVTFKYAGNKRSQSNAPDILTVQLGAGFTSITLNASSGPAVGNFLAVVGTDNEKLIINQRPVGDNQGALLIEVSVTPV